MNATVIIDNRQISKDVLSNHAIKGWDLHIWTSEKVNIPSGSFRHKYEGGGGMDYNFLITNPSFWEQLKKYEYVLIFQHDSGLLHKQVDQFVKAGYDYYGAPWKVDASWANKDRSGGNGGLSLRKVQSCTKLVNTKPYHPRYGNEDVYFSRLLPNVAPYEWCKKFSVETDFKLDTFGYHAINKHLTRKEVGQIMNQYR